ncbi:hypothetical protein KKG45_01815, partial [bacterium]|nr:hypothetical protein [bacterium]
DEDRRLRDLARIFPVRFREVPPEHGQISLKQTLGHLAFWDRFTVEFFDARCHRRAVDAMTLGEFEHRNRAELERIYDMPYEQAHEIYKTATNVLLTFLREHWDDLDAEARANFNIPLKHRRHHRRLLAKALEVFAPGLAAGEEAREKAG